MRKSLQKKKSIKFLLSKITLNSIAFWLHWCENCETTSIHSHCLIMKEPELCENIKSDARVHTIWEDCNVDHIQTKQNKTNTHFIKL